LIGTRGGVAASLLARRPQGEHRPALLSDAKSFLQLVHRVSCVSI
jgi:hypothetical protein